MHELWRDRLLIDLARWSFRWRKPILITSLLVAVASVVLTVYGLGFASDRNALINTDLDWNQRFINWRTSFDLGGDLVVVADTAGRDGQITDTSRQRARDAMDQLGQTLRATAHIDEVWWKLKPEDLGPRLLRLADTQTFNQAIAHIDTAIQALAITDLDAFLTIRPQADDIAALDILPTLLDALAERYEISPRQPLALEEDLLADIDSATRYLATDNDRLLLMTVRPARDNASLEPFEDAIRTIRQQIKTLRVQHPELAIGLTGIETVESDETAAAVRDATITSTVAAILILLLLLVSYRGVVIPLALATPLALAMAWTFGFTTLAVGHLQIISVVFTAILLGLGADFSIHLIAALMRRLPANRDITEARYERAVVSACRVAGPGLITGALTTALAFGTTLLTDFTGVAEMGLIAAAGVMLALIATLLTLPGLLWYCRQHLATLSRHRSGRSPQSPHDPPRTTLAWLPLVLIITATAAATWFTTQNLRFDDDLIRLLPRHVESVDWQQRIVRDGGRTLWYGVSICDSLEQARERTRTLRNDDANLIGELGGIALLFPPDEAQRLEQLRARHQQITACPRELDLLPQDPQQAFDRINTLVSLALTTATLADITSDAPWIDQTRQAARRWATMHVSISDNQRAAATEALRADLINTRARMHDWLTAATDTTPLNPNEIPQLLRATFVSDTTPQQYAIEIYPRLPRGITNALDPHFLPRFVEHLRTIDTDATGVMLQVYESGRLIRRSYLFAGILAFVLVYIVVALDLRSLRDAALALLPVFIGMVFGATLLTLFKQPLTPASIIGLPLLFGVGVDSGVHLLHRYRLHPRVTWPGLTDGTGWSIALTGSLTLIGFGSLILADHRGMAGLGLLMTTGIALTLIACFTVIPTLLRRLTPRR
ncbi:MMPL family transporter [Mucisphaera calidilacus]|uniref:MMPL family protein n=1 Tax=Mucisphaera calidilacus TaxID=2527982 RepID=A0A518BXL4_9BACT|nr:MMPL family transporter [Mucisphaera calidilacus]QDU71694.1 MMPL family protein [Mucisphaera calidilacus]